MAGGKNSAWLLLIGVGWFALALMFGLYFFPLQFVRGPVIFVFGVSALLAGFFLGRGYQKLFGPKPENIVER
jgi:hypothetical protein